MTLSEIVQAEHIVPDLQATDRWEAIDELIGQLVSSGAIKEEDREAITEVVKKRENSMSTGIGFGIGIPHAATDVIGDVVGALGRSKVGIDFEAQSASQFGGVVSRAARSVSKASSYIGQHRQVAA